MTTHIVAGNRLREKLTQSAEIAGCCVGITKERHLPWFAAMFMGGHHELTAVVIGDTAIHWLECLDEYAVHLPGFVISKLEVTTVEFVGGDLTATIEVETVKEA